VGLYEEIVDALNGIYGAHAGTRAVHAKGVVCEGTFTATPRAAALTRAAHMQGEPVRATVRLSNAGGDPEAHDGTRDGRGLAVKLYLPDGTRTDIVATTTPVFVVRTPEDFLELMLARRPDPETGQPDLEKVGAFLEAHPESLPAIQTTLGTPPPASWAQRRYNGLHAFRFVNGAGEARWVRYSWLPEAGEESIDDEEAMSRPPDYLRRELLERLERGPIAFGLELQLAEEGDPTDDPTAAWPPERETVDAGRLEVTGLDSSRERGGDVLVFDPTRVTDGIELSDDPILHARPHAYAVSVERRSGATR
jgi:catalase